MARKPRQIADVLLHRAIVGVGQIGARAAARAYGSVLADVSQITKQIHDRLDAAEKKFRDVMGNDWDR